MAFSNMRVRELADQAADIYLENGGKLNAAIAKVAKENELSPTQIQRVVEVANHEVNARHYKSAEDRRFVFELASRDGVMALLDAGKGAPAEKTASDLDSFFVLDHDRRMPKTAGEDREVPALYERFGGQTAAWQAAAHTLNRAYAKLAEYNRQLRCEKSACDLSRAENFNRFVKEAQRLMLEEGVSFNAIAAGANSRIPSEITQAILKDAHATLSKRANAVEKRLLDEFDPAGTKALGMKIVNGNHPLFIHLRATAGAARDGLLASCYGDAVNTCLAGVVTAVHTLNTSDDVKKYIEHEVQPFAHNVQRGVKYAMEYVREHAGENTWLAKTANFGGVTSLLDKIGRIFQLLNQGGQAVESVGNNASKFVRDLLSPAIIRAGTVAQGVKESA